MMCDVCKQKEQAEKANVVFKEAQEAADRSGECYGIYIDGQGNHRYIVASFGQGYPIYRTVPPRLFTANRNLLQDNVQR